MKKISFLVILTISIIFVLDFAAPIEIHAQTATATLVGRAVDETDAALPGVKITLTQTTTGQTRAVTSDESGNFVFLLLPAGEYELTAELAGFQKLVRRELEFRLTSAQVSIYRSKPVKFRKRSKLIRKFRLCRPNRLRSEQ